MKNTLLLILFPCFTFSQSNIFPTSGNIGVGTLSPAGEIHVVANTGAADFIVERSDGTWVKGIAGTTGSGFYFKSNARLTFSPALSLSSAAPDNLNSMFFYGPDHPTYPGRLVLGTDIPGDDSKFSVNGRIKSEELKIVNDVEAPDYVFSTDYKLRSIEEIEMYIKNEGHLPEIPSAKEFKENGIMIGQMSFDLLKKVEEMTLYIIELNKKISTLENDLKKLNE